jgi:hypothetical protein
MNFKGITIAAFGLACLLPAAALEERITLVAGAEHPLASTKSLIGSWQSEGAVLKKGYKGRQDYVVEDQSYGASVSNDLLLHFDDEKAADAAGNWNVRPGSAFSVNKDKVVLGHGSASFLGPESALSLTPGPGSVFGKNSSFRDFSIEFWLYPANADNGEVVLLWQSLRKCSSGVLPQQLSCVVSGGRLQWSFAGFFCKPGVAKASDAEFRVELRGRSPLVPRAWSHHLLRFDGDTGLLEYLVDGKPEADTYATASGSEGGTVYEPTIGAAAPLKFCPEYSGLADELRISRGFVAEPTLRPYGRDPSLVLTPVADLGYGHSRLVAVDAEFKTPGSSSLEFAYRIADSWAAWRSVDAGKEEAWTPLRPGEALPENARGRYVQVRAELYPDGTGKLSPSLSSITLRYEADPPPPAPSALVAYPKNGAVELHWKRVPEADLAGYLVYYGERPGEYFGTGADQGPSPIDVGNTTTLTLTGIPNGKLLYFVVAAYDSAPDADEGLPGYDTTAAGAAGSTGSAESAVAGTALSTKRAESRAGEFSSEVSARPSRTAQ